ncbi:hypothetical protein [Calothrix sp. UHCC 0171]|nr:hypothetical protein [Calothrix sp. UHCC 0171]MEA5571138.1 hypothetical protein [Calothrix sp. UHCC 0171]
MMSKERKGNREAKKAKKQSDGTKKQKKDPNRHDSPIVEIVNKQRKTES